MSLLRREDVIAALRSVQDPELFKDIVTLNMVKDVQLDGSAVRVQVQLTTPNCPMKETIRRDVENAVRKAGADHVEVELTAPPPRPGGPGGGPRPTGGAPQPNREALPQVRHIIAVGAGKGGVGKSTVALNLAVGFARTGARVGLMDGDIYGPSAPTLLGIKGIPPQVRGSKILPHHVHGIHAVTIGSLVEADKPLIWRGPMAHGAFKQLLTDNTEWPDLDYLIVDLPPGTGDVPLTLCQLLPLAGAVIVVTPQQVAVDDAVRAARMFQQLATPILGVVENLSGDLFGKGGGEKMAKELG